MQAPSLTGHVYFITFIDDFSRKTWVYLLKKKSEAFDIFRRFKFLVQKESGKYIKFLRSDRGGEYILTDFMEFCQSHGIKRQFTTRYTLQQNGVAKRKNQTIMNMARSMLKGKHILNEYWGDAVICSVYILNKIPTKSVKNQVPYEAWSGKNKNVSHLNILRCVSYAHVPKEMRIKLVERSEKCVFIGYSEDSKAYRLYNPVTKKYFINKDVEFKEEEAWDGSIDKIVSGGAKISHEDDDEDEQVIQGGQLIP
jgi:hypothetical protein